MHNLTAYAPFADAGCDELFRGFCRPVRVDRAPAAIKMDVVELNDAYVVKAEIPGVAKDDIQVSIEGNQVTIGFQTIPGKTYRVEYKDDLNAAQWQQLNGRDYLAVGASLTVQDNIGTNPQRFYRIVQLD